MTLEITDANFEQEVLKSSKPVMVDFWAAWCGPCRAIAPSIEALAEEYKDRAVVGKMDVDANDQVPAQYSVRSIPTVLFFKDGELVDKSVGAAPKSSFEEKLKALL
ncbi:MAG: thioredoxin [Prevotellaceae bacterium]|jgi:thioredoxin 1|nr:thioredoxin [Prevotellaceae bacterium]